MSDVVARTADRLDAGRRQQNALFQDFRAACREIL
jgi:hypothetical protein